MNSKSQKEYALMYLDNLYIILSKYLKLAKITNNDYYKDKVNEIKKQIEEEIKVINKL